VLDLVWHMYLNCSGYSTSSQDFVKSLLKKNYPVAVDKNDYPDNYNFAGLSDYNINMFHELQYVGDIAETLSVWNFPPPQFKTKGKINIGYADYEVNRMPPDWVEQCNMMDEIWTSSLFCKNVFIESGVQKNIKVIPHAIDSHLWHSSVSPLPIQNRRGFCFLFVSEWMPRKGIYELLRAWFSAFSSKDDVYLILKTYLGEYGNINNIRKEVEKIRQEFDLTQDRCAPILFYSDFIEDHKMPNLFQCADVLVAPSLGEGFGLSVAQAQMMGIPVIATDWSALSEICNNDVGYMIDIEGTEPVSEKQVDLIPAYEDAEWAKLNINSLIDNMKHVYNNSEELTVKSKKCQDFMRKFNYDNIGNILIDNINTVLDDSFEPNMNSLIYFDRDSGQIGEQYTAGLYINYIDKNKISENTFVDYYPNKNFLKIYYDGMNYFWGKLI
jgi:glycosyltransferase involved in cell wall biosynthesis